MGLFFNADSEFGSRVQDPIPKMICETTSYQDVVRWGLIDLPKCNEDG